MDDFEKAKKIIDAKTPCSQLTEAQLESIGDYLMEQMHPGEAHELMDKMMGGEGSESLKTVHKNMGLNYLGCSASTGFNPGMMNMMTGNWSNFNNLKNYNSMMGNFGFNNMMGWGWGWSLFGWVTMILFWVLTVVVIVALIKWLLADKNKKK